MRKLIYTDGSSSGNPGPGGFAAIISDGKTVKEVGGYEEKTTNNRMELMAAIFGLKETEIGDSVKIITDSSYLLKGITEWIEGWIRNDWMTKTNGQVANKDLWKVLYDLVQDRSVEWVLVKGHASTAGNNRADMLATTFTSEVVPVLYQGPISGYKIDLKEPTLKNINADKKPNTRSQSNAKAYSYLSYVDGLVKKHKTWADCESRIRGRSNAKFRKSLSPENEQEILRSWGLS